MQTYGNWTFARWLKSVNRCLDVWANGKTSVNFTNFDFENAWEEGNTPADSAQQAMDMQE